MNRLHRRYCASERWARRLGEAVLPWVLRDVDLGRHALEVGPGPGLTTDLLAPRVETLTAVEIDGRLADALGRRLRGTNVRVVQGDGTRLPFPDRTFSGAVSFTMLHHVPSPALQDALLAEVRRVLRPGATFAGADSQPSLRFRLAHLWDTMVVVDPDAFPARLEAAGFAGVAVRRGEGAFRFRAHAP